MMWNHKDFPVGYGKPPTYHQFKPGQSGNPKGRPRGSTSLDKILKNIGSARITINENGKRRTVSKIEAVFILLFNKAMSGDYRAMQLLFNYLQKASALEKPEEDEPELYGEDARKAAIVRILDKLRDLGIWKDEEEDSPNQ